MKRCPECRRNYTDETLNICVDDGATLLDGPASADEPATAVFAVPPSGGNYSYEKAFKLNRNARYLMALGNVYAAAGQREKALDVLSQLTDMKKEQYISSYYFAAVYAGLNDKDQAFVLLDKAFEEHSDSLASLKYSPLMGNLGSDPRFKAIIGRAGLPE